MMAYHNRMDGLRYGRDPDHNLVDALPALQDVRERCHRPDLKHKCPPDDAIIADAVVQECPPPIIVSFDIDYGCKRIP